MPSSNDYINRSYIANTDTDASSVYHHWNPIYIEDSGLSKSTALEMQTLFNISALAPYRQMPEAYLGHIFMCRPRLNLTDANLEKLKQLPTTAGLLTNSTDKDLFLLLSDRSSTKWLPIITNMAKNYSVNDMELKSVDKAETYYGHTIKYAKHNEEYKHGGTISLDFRNDSFRSVTKLMWFWMSYMYNVSKEDYLDIDFWNMWNGILDYDASLFYLVTKRDGRELVYWEELVGIHPRRVPLSDYSWNDNYIITDTVTIDFDYNIRRDPLDPGILADINVLSIQNTNANLTDIIRISSNSGMVLNDIYSYGPVIKCSNKANGEKTYYLEYRPAGRSNSNYIATTYYY